MRDTVRRMQAEREARAAEAHVAAERGRTAVLREKTEFLQGVLDNLSEPMFIRDRSHRIIYANDALCETAGYQREDIIGETGYLSFDEDTARRFREENERFFAKGELWERDRTFEDSLGNVRTVRIISAP